MTGADAAPEPALRDVALTAVVVAWVVSVLYLDGSATVSTAPLAVAATLAGLGVGGVLTATAQGAGIGRRIERTYWNYWPLGLAVLLVVVVGTALLAYWTTTAPGRGGPAVGLQFLVGTFLGVFGATLVAAARAQVDGGFL